MSNEYKLKTLASMSHIWLANQKSLLPARIAQALYAGVKGFFNHYTVDINADVNKQLAKDNGNSYFGQFVVKKNLERKIEPQPDVMPQVVPGTHYTPIPPPIAAPPTSDKTIQPFLLALNKFNDTTDIKTVAAAIDGLENIKAEHPMNANTLKKLLNQNWLTAFLGHAQSTQAKEDNKNNTRADQINVQTRRLINLGLDANAHQNFIPYLNKVKNCETCTTGLEAYNKENLKSRFRSLKKVFKDPQSNHREKLYAFITYTNLNNSHNIQLNGRRQKEFIKLLESCMTKHFDAFLQDNNTLQDDAAGAKFYRLILDKLGENYKLTDKNTKNLESKIDYIFNSFNLFDARHQNLKRHKMQSHALNSLIFINKKLTSFSANVIRTIFEQMQADAKYLDSSFILCRALQDAGVDLYSQQFATDNDIKNHPHYTALLQALETEGKKSFRFIKMLSKLDFPLTNELEETIKDQLSKKELPITNDVNKKLALLRHENIN